MYCKGMSLELWRISFFGDRTAFAVEAERPGEVCTLRAIFLAGEKRSIIHALRLEVWEAHGVGGVEGWAGYQRRWKKRANRRLTE